MVNVNKMTRDELIAHLQKQHEHHARTLASYKNPDWIESKIDTLTNKLKKIDTWLAGLRDEEE